MKQIKSALKVDKYLREFCKYIDTLRQQDEDFIMLITGETRSGKSTLGLDIGFLIDPKLDMEKQIIYDLPTFKKRIFEAKGEVFVGDEAIFDAFNRNAMSSFNKQLIQIFTVCASRNHVIILVIPKVSWLDNPVKERISFMFWTLKTYTPYEVKRGLYRAYDWHFFNPFQDNPFPQFAWNGFFSQLPSDVYSQYEEIKNNQLLRRLHINQLDNPLLSISKIQIVKYLLQDPRFENVEKKDLYKVFGDVVYKF